MANCGILQFQIKNIFIFLGFHVWLNCTKPKDIIIECHLELGEFFMFLSFKGLDIYSASNALCVIVHFTPAFSIYLSIPAIVCPFHLNDCINSFHLNSKKLYYSAKFLVEPDPKTSYRSLQESWNGESMIVRYAH